MVDSHQIERPFSAYTGSESFLFVCYAHDDADVIYPELQWLDDQGVNVWYDEGISAGKNWRSEIGDSLLKADYFLFYISKASLRSEHCNREINLALDERKKIIPIYLENVELTSDLKIGLSRVQALFNTDKKYQQLLLNALGTQAASTTASPVQRSNSNNRLKSAVFGLVILAILGVGLLLYSQSTSKIAEPPVAESEAMPILAFTADPTRVDATTSIAVLPFVNMSNDPDNEYFSEGISEELLHTLAKIRQLRVAARTSSFAFKGKNQDITEIGKRLNVDTVLEGSVRKSGKRVRITAQLINVEDGFRIWSDAYDRDLTDIFAIQDEISAAIVDALKVHLIAGETVVTSHVIDAEAYNFYLLARYNFRRRTENSLNLAVKQYEQATDIDPGYAAAWAGKASATMLLSENQYGTLPDREAFQQAQMMLDSAFSLDPNLGDAHATQSLFYQLSINPNPREALLSLQRALSDNPNDGTLYVWRAFNLDLLGQINQSYEVMKKAFQVEPLHQYVRQQLSWVHIQMGDYAAARALVTAGSSMAYLVEAKIAGRQGRFAKENNDRKRAIEVSDGRFLNRLRNDLSINYFFDLKNPEVAGQNGPNINKLFFQAVLEPRTAYTRLQQLPNNLRGMTVLVWSLIALKRYNDALVVLAPKEFNDRPLQGHLVMRFNDMNLAFLQAYCLQQLGRSEEALELARRIRKFLDTAVANGSIFHLNLLAKTQILLGERDAAMQSLEQAWQIYTLNWVDLRGAWYSPLHSRKDFQALKERMQKHLNAERAKLSWEPVTI